jgi:RNA polymerase sigma-70 factor, ECF subfamily
MQTTPISLLERLRQLPDEAAWERFVQLYSPLLCAWASRLGLSGQEADDLVQDVFTLLVRKLPEFRYDPRKSFRAWLWTVTVNKCRERRRRPAVALAPATDRDLAEVAGTDERAEIDEAEYRDYLVRRALELMRAEFQPGTWKAFWECTAQGRPAAEVARELGLTENAVYLAKGRVLRRLRKELDGLLP